MTHTLLRGKPVPTDTFWTQKKHARNYLKYNVMVWLTTCPRPGENEALRGKRFVEAILGDGVARAKRILEAPPSPPRDTPATPADP